MSGLSARSGWRRLGVCVAVLVLADLAVPSLLERSEASRYESDALFRFENSDLFALGPVVDYLREHPVGRRPRVVFFGNSIVWGYGVQPSETVPARFQQFAPDTQVLNFGINGFEIGSSYLITKALGEAVSVVYVFPHGQRADAKLPKLIDVSADDARQFGLQPRSAAQEVCERLFGFWQLGRYAYRLQAAWFGTSTRQAVYMRKGEWARRLLGKGGRGPASKPLVMDDPTVRVQWTGPDSERPVGPEDLQAAAGAHPVLWQYAAWLAEHRIHGVVVELPGYESILTNDERTVLNAHFSPYVMAVRISVPESALVDRMHFNRAGAEAVARTLYEQTGHAVGLRAS